MPFVWFVLCFYAVYRREKRGMAAMVRPVCINHSDFRYSRVAMLAFEVFAAKFNIRKVHCKSIFVYKCLELIFVKLRKSRKSYNACRNDVVDTQRIGLFKRSLTALYGFITYFLIASSCAGASLPKSIYTFAVRTVGRLETI